MITTTDSIATHASISSAPKEFGKKKRANRSAKLKQCKLDARREQWLSQVKNKGCKEEPTGGRVFRESCDKERKRALENLEVTQRGGGNEEEIENGLNHHHHHHDFDSDSPSNSPTSSSALGGSDSGTNFTGSSSNSSSSSSSSSGGCCSGNISEEEEERDDNCLDDWEAMADALAADDANKQENQNDNHPCSESESSAKHEPVVQLDSNLNNTSAVDEDPKQECSRTVPARQTTRSCQAWRPDDVFRPQSLPNLSKQLSLQMVGEKRYGSGGCPWTCTRISVPSSCPICYEDLDNTDSSFLPCLCGFRLCLFCHHRILEGDGRCPGCRKPYGHHSLKAEAIVNGGRMTLLSRSCSMIDRS